MRILHDLEVFMSPVSLQEKMLFTKYLAVMLKSGIVLSEALIISMEQSQNKTLKLILKKVIADVEDGESFEVALAKFPRVFDRLYLSLIRVGEESGNLEKNLVYLAALLQKEYLFRKKVQGAAMYPVIILLVALVAGVGLSYFVLPQLVDLFESLDVTLPFSTKVLLFFGAVVRDYGVVIAVGLTGIGILVHTLLQTVLKPAWHRALISLPIIGMFVQQATLTSFCRNLGMMIQSGLPITTALHAEGEIIDNLVYQGYVRRLEKAMEKGKEIGTELSLREYPYIPIIVGKMIHVGERSGKLDESFLYLGDFFEDEVDAMTKNLPNLIEPVLLVIIGIVVAFVALSIITPIYQLTGSIH